MAGQIIEQNKATHRRIAAVFSGEGGRIESIDELVASNYTNHTPLPPGVPEGRDGLKVFANALRSAFPDLTHRVDVEVGEGDLATIYITRTGTMKGGFLGMPATGKQATWSEVHISRFKDGKVVEHWAAVDQFGMAQQLGLIPAPQAAGAPRRPT